MCDVWSLLLCLLKLLPLPNSLITHSLRSGCPIKGWDNFPSILHSLCHCAAQDKIQIPKNDVCFSVFLLYF